MQTPGLLDEVDDSLSGYLSEPDENYFQKKPSLDTALSSENDESEPGVDIQKARKYNKLTTASTGRNGIQKASPVKYNKQKSTARAMQQLQTGPSGESSNARIVRKPEAATILKEQNPNQGTKRKPGRPKKSESAKDTDSNQPTPQKRRGRPPKRIETELDKDHIYESIRKGKPVKKRKYTKAPK
ncbi:hypothetical protein BJV82DRAFT_636762 [Fennellomyces sp. T-0311]|nr:hypothetical protein BJV82DRAFT_636762 [Fennellomyces sp. T-0311]